MCGDYSHWRILRRTDRVVTMSGAFSGRSDVLDFPVVSAACKLIGEDGIQYAAIINEALLDESSHQVESLLSVHQVLQLVCNAIDDRARCEYDIEGRTGTQSARFGSTRVPFFFDGVKCFYQIESITNDELHSLPTLTLTDGSRQFDPLVRVATRRRSNNKHTINDILKWKAQLGFIPDHVVEKTLKCTTQMIPTVEAETREVMRDHFQSRFPQLKLRRINDTVYVDTFFSSVTSVRGYKCFNLYVFKKSGLDRIYLMRSRAQGATTLSEFVTECDIPTKIKSDNAPEFQGKQWMNLIRQHCIQTEFTEPHHPNQNLAERRGGIIKAATVHILFVTKAPLKYWCFALEYVTFMRAFIAKRSIGWRTPAEVHWGDTPDISMLRFVFYQPIWYHDPKPAFPNPKMYKGRFLGIAPATGDHFCYRILTEPPKGSGIYPQVIARSNIRSRTVVNDDSVQGDVRQEGVQDSTRLRFLRRDNTELADYVQHDGDSEESTDQADDLVDDSMLITQVLDPFPEGTTSDDPFVNGYIEVYGPSKAIPTHSFDNNDMASVAKVPEPTVTLDPGQLHGREAELTLLHSHVPGINSVNSGQVDSNSNMAVENSAQLISFEPLTTHDDQNDRVPQVTQSQDLGCDNGVDKDLRDMDVLSDTPVILPEEEESAPTQERWLFRWKALLTLHLIIWISTLTI